MADRVVVLCAGKVEQAGTPQEVFEHPANAFVMDFLGHVNVFHGRVQNGVAHLGDMGDVELACPDYPHAESWATSVYVRPHELDIDPTSQGPSSLKGRIVHIYPGGLHGQGPHQGREHRHEYPGGRDARPLRRAEDPGRRGRIRVAKARARVLAGLRDLTTFWCGPSQENVDRGFRWLSN